MGTFCILESAAEGFYEQKKRDSTKNYCIVRKLRRRHCMKKISEAHQGSICWISAARSFTKGSSYYGLYPKGAVYVKKS